MNWNMVLNFVLIIMYVEQCFSFEVDCNNLRMGQYICPDPQYSHIDPKTQQFKGCRKDNKAKGFYMYV